MLKIVLRRAQRHSKNKLYTTFLLKVFGIGFLDPLIYKMFNL